MKIAIVGGGISGLSTYLNLQKQLSDKRNLAESTEVTVYEPHDLPRLGNKRADDIPSSGGGYGLAANGMASLRRLDPELHDQIFRSGFPTPKTVMKCARGWTLGVLPFSDLRGEHPECCVMVLREVVIAAMYDRIASDAIVRQRVVKVVDGDEEATIFFENGQSQCFDLVIGADGVWSKARPAVLGDGVVPEYRGLFTIAGWVSTDYLPAPADSGQAAHGQTVMTFGPNGFFAYTPYTTGDTAASEEHIRGDATLPPGKSAFWWSRSAQKDSAANPDNALLIRDLEQRFRNWKDPAILNIVQHSEIALKIPTFVMPKVSTWSGKRVVLVGDSAHALPSSSGQGVSQCLEDAEAFSTLLVGNMADHGSQDIDLQTLGKTFAQYMEVRKAHVEKVLDAGNRAGDSSRDMGTVAEFTMYGFMWAMCRSYDCISLRVVPADTRIVKLFGAMFLKTVLEYDLPEQLRKVKKQ